MPELPEVEVFKKYVDDTSLDQTIQSVEVKNSLVLEDTTPEELQSKLTGKKFLETQRHGKYLLIRCKDLWLFMHFGMTGYLRYLQHEKEPSHTRILMGFENGKRLAYVCQRMLGRVGLVTDPKELINKKNLGPDALELDLKSFKELMKSRKGRAKYILMNQKIIAGIGNIYSDEILYQTGVHPRTRINELSSGTLKEMWEHIHKVLKTVIDKKASLSELPHSYLLPHRYEGGKCPQCGSYVEKIDFSGRTAYYCPVHQHEL